jgi:hypothetical protein
MNSIEWRSVFAGIGRVAIGWARRFESVRGFAWAALLLIAIALPARALVLNEMTIQGDELVEVYNNTAGILDINGMEIREGGDTYVIAGVPPLPPGEYYVLNPPGDLFDDQGGYIELLEGGKVNDAAYYGQFGSAPLPPGAGGGLRQLGGGTSLARAPDASLLGAPPTPTPGGDGFFWTIDLTPTFGSANDAPSSALGTSLFLNELDPKPIGTGDSVELFNPFAVDFPLAGWFVCNGDAFAPLAGTVPGFGFLTVALDPGFELEENELVYLFRDDEVRVDQIGFHLPPVRSTAPALDFCQCYSRFTDGSGPSNGWNWFSSGGGATLLRLLCTPNATNENITTCDVTPIPTVSTETWSRTKARYR